MAERKVARGGKKNRKHRRNKDRSPSMARYRLDQRWIANKAKRARREQTKRKRKATKQRKRFLKIAEG